MKNTSFRGLFWASLLMLVFTLFVFLSMNVCASGETIYVDDDGGKDYTTIQDAINSANGGDTIYVYSGTYYENVLVNKTIDLVGENKETTVIDGGGNGDVVCIFSNWVNVNGFTLQNSGINESYNQHYAGLKITYRRVVDLTYVYFQSDNNTVSNCKMVNNQIGISIIETDNNQIIGNDISSEEWTKEGGISIIGSNSNYNLIKQNTIDHYDIGISNSHWSGCGDHNTVIENEITNSGAGIRIDSNYNLVQGNTITNIFIHSGMRIQGGNNQIIGNEISQVSQGYGLTTGCDNLVQNNYIHDISNTALVHSSRSNFIDNTISNCHCGVEGSEIDDVYFEDNVISNTKMGSMFYVEYLYNATLINNVMDKGIRFFYEPERLSEPGYIGGINNNIMTGNTVNGKPLIYKEDESYLTIKDEPAGQIILVNCDNIRVDNIDLSTDTLLGLELIDSENCSISNITFSKNIMNAILLLNSHYNIIQDNTITDVDLGDWGGPDVFVIRYSNNNVVKNNQLLNNFGGIILNVQSCNNRIEGNTISTDGGEMDGVGIKILDRSDDTNISYNTISDCNTGVQIAYIKGGQVFNTVIYMNTFENCFYDFADYSVPMPPQISSLDTVKTLSYEDNPTRILKNNFMGLKIFTMFQVRDPSASFTNWVSNYWGRFRILPKLIIGFKGMTPAQIKIDWTPARRPFTI